MNFIYTYACHLLSALFAVLLWLEGSMIIKQLLREAYKQGYVNGHYDSLNNESLDDDDFNVWIDEALADEHIGDLEIPEFILENIRRDENKNAS